MKKLILVLALPVLLIGLFTHQGIMVDPSLVKFSITSSEMMGPIDVDPELLAKGMVGVLPELDTVSSPLRLVNMWATWCGPCLKEIPDLNKIVEDYEDRGVFFLAVSNESDDHVTRWILRQKNFRFDYRLVNGNDELVTLLNALDYENGGSAIPIHYLMDRDWKVLKVWVGSSDQNILEIRNALNEQLSEL
jgi:thiol-disulfide isomerase/thioredoxin